MASNYTSNYNLCQWEPGDKVLRTEFNADNAKLDAALDGLAQTVAGHATALAKMGNCQLYFTTYTGSGQYDSTYPNSLTFPHKPVVVFITTSMERLVLIQGTPRCWSEQYTGGMTDIMITWSGNTVRWYTGSAQGQMNASGTTYQVVALLQAG